MRRLRVCLTYSEVSGLPILLRISFTRAALTSFRFFNVWRSFRATLMRPYFSRLGVDGKEIVPLGARKRAPTPP